MAVICASIPKTEWDFTQGDSGNIDVFINDISDIDFDPYTILDEMPKDRENCYDFDIEGGPKGKFFSAWVYIDFDDLIDLIMDNGLITDNIVSVFERCFNDFATEDDPAISLYIRRK